MTNAEQDPRASRLAFRNELCPQFPAGPSRVTARSYLEFGDHWRSIVTLLGTLAHDRGLDSDNQVHVNTFKITLADEHRGLIVHCDGDGYIPLYILNEGNGTHFVP